jgi:predicted DNA-binding transcriptional regulator YafY
MANLERALNRTERLFNIILLLQQRPSMSSRDLAEHFDVSRRTIFRDLRSLADSGIPLTYADEGGYEILDGYQIPPLMFSAQEAATLLIGVEFMKLQSDASLRVDAEAVEMKITEVLPAPIKDFVTRLRQRIVLDPYWIHRQDMQEGEEGRWYRISEAVAEQRAMVMDYRVASRDELTKRKVNPLALVYYTDHWNLIAYDHLRKALRTFRLDHIEDMYVLTERFDPPADFDLKEYLREKGAPVDTPPIRIAFEVSSYRFARSHIPAVIEKELKDEKAGEVVVTFRFENLRYLARWLMRFGSDVRVIEPEELRTHVREEATSVIANLDETPAL